MHANREAAVEADAIGRAAVEVDAIGEQQLTIGEQQPKQTRSGAAAEADANEEQQLKRTQSGASGRNRGQADAIGEQQLCTENCQAPDYAR